MTDEYSMIDRFLRNNLDDTDYAEYSAALDSVFDPKLMEMRCADVESNFGSGRCELKFVFHTSSSMIRAMEEWKEFNK